MEKAVCPKCSGLLESITYRGIEVNRCMQCDGIWFDALAADTLKTVRGSESLDRGNPYIGRKYDRITDGVKCPRCHVNLRRMLDIDRHSIWYERCAQCGGIWFDAGEFSQFKQNFRENHLLNRARAAWHRQSK